MSLSTSLSRQIGGSALIMLCALVFSLPFELERPVFNIGSLSLTNVELLLFATLFLILLFVVMERRWQQPDWLKIPKLWLILLGWFALAMIISALLAPEFSANSLKAALRSLSGLSLAVLLPQVVKDKSQLRFLIGALLVGGVISIGLGLVEVLSERTFPFLSLFRHQPTLAGPFVRLSGSFNHANQTAMFIEATVPFLVAAVWWFSRKKYRVLAFLGGVLVLLYLQATFLTYSRSSFITILVSSLLVGALIWYWQPARRRLAYYWGAVAGLVLLLIGFNAVLSPVLRLRLSSEGDNEWYNASFDIPEHIEMEAGEIIPVTLAVTNEGSLLWSSQTEKPINLGGRWYRASDGARSDIELHWTLDEDVAPGETLVTTVPMVVPVEPGEYEFEWDLVQEDVVWFSAKNGLKIRSQVTVVENPDGRNIDREPDRFTIGEPDIQPIPNRRILWSIAAKQLLERPLLGIGIDNFRLTYGEVMGWQAWNDTIHTNNWYIETAVSVGILGSIPFFGWLALLGLDFLKHIRSRKISIWQIALVTGLLAYLIHGMLDYFLLFNGTGLLFWIFVGMWMVLAWPEQSA